MLRLMSMRASSILDKHSSRKQQPTALYKMLNDNSNTLHIADLHIEQASDSVTRHHIQLSDTPRETIHTNLTVLAQSR